ncbi:DUF3367 domain-containing protein [Nocardioides sp. zg-1308]|nr:alpha-(1->3)-arabinofuranosyltransferase family protein [Nocardioides sp. zg-1308]NPD06388.1 DUF3367 domain-containing protein [Nocardioides sp. zg-1308]
MTVAGVRTLVVAVLAAAVAVRVSGAQAVTGAYARVAAAPTASLRSAADGWSVSGTFGDATAQGLRDLPLAVWSWLADLVGAPASVARTGWCVLVFVLAVVGAVRLGRACSGRASTQRRHGTVDEPWSPWVAAALYACGPLLVTTVLHAPGDGLVVALLPWVLVPLVGRDVGWRPAAGSAAWLGLAGVGSPPWGLVALLAGLVSAAVTSRHAGGARQLLRWSLLAAASSAWWLAAYAWEVAHAVEVTGLVASPSALALGDTLGLPSAEPLWLVLLAFAPAVVAVAALVLRVGTELVLVGALLGTSLVAAVVGMASDGWPSWLPVPASSATATDSVPAPWVAVLVWVALAGLVAWSPLVEHLGSRSPAGVAGPWTRRTGAAVAGLTVLGLVSVAGPVLAVQERTSERADIDRAQWAEVARWSATAPPGRVLVLPAVADGRVDPVVAEALVDRPWVARDTVPLSGAAATAALDDAVARLERGLDGPGTAAALRHLGISYVLLRNDVPAAVDRERPVGLVRHALSRQGASRVAVVEAAGEAPAGLVDLGVHDPGGTIEIWALDEAADGSVHAGAPVSVLGDSGVVGDLADAGLEPEQALVLGRGPDGTSDAVSDSARRRDVDQRVASDPFGPVVGADEPWTAVPAGAARTPTASRGLSGADEVRASSSAADLDGHRRLTGAVPAAAVDGNGFTAWQSRRGTVVGEWWEIAFDGTTDLADASLQVVQNAFASHLVSRVVLQSDDGSTEVDVPADGLVPLAAVGRTDRLRVVATGVTGPASGDSSFAIAELSVPGLEVEEELVVAGGATATWVLAARPPSFATCVPSYPVGGAGDPAASETVCSRAVGVDGPDSGSLARVVTSEGSVEVGGRVWLRAADSAESRALADRLARPSVTATGSSVASPDLVGDAQAAADGDPSTAWRPAPEDAAPTLALSWDRPTRVTGLRVTTAERELASTPSRVVVGFDEGTDPVAAEIGDDGVVRLPPVRTRSVSVIFGADQPVGSVDSVTGATVAVPMALSEVEVIGGPETEYDADRSEELGCGSGPDVTVHGETYETAVRVSARQLVEASLVTARLCEEPTLPAGEARVSVEASFSWTPVGLVLAPPDGFLGDVAELGSAVDAPASLPAGVIAVDPDGRSVEVDGPSTVALAVPAGTGWSAVADGAELPTLTVDGWAQAWQVPEGAERVSLRYSSVEVLRVAAGAGAFGWLLVLAVALGLRPRRRRPSPAAPDQRRDQAMVGRSTHA